MSALAAASAPNTGVNVVALAVLIALFLAVTVMGFLATRWRRAESMESLDEWGLGGRGFGTWVTWFLLGGDLYTAYTFIAVPAAMFALGSVSGFFAVPYTIVVYPIIFVFMSRLWSVSHRHGYVTAADFVRGRYGSRGLSLAVAVTGILATMPYIALQLVGIEAVLEVIGVGGNSALARDLPLFIAFAVLAAYTYSSGLRAPALIAFVKDALIYLVIIVAVIYLPSRYGGWGHIFDAAETKMTRPGAPKGSAFIPAPTQSLPVVETPEPEGGSTDSGAGDAVSGVQGGVEGGVAGGVVGGEIGGVHGGELGGVAGGVLGGQVGGTGTGTEGTGTGGNEAPVAPPPPPPPPPPSGPLRVGGNVKAPVVVDRAEPNYTETARKARIAGIVVVEAIIDKNGNVDNVKVIKGLPAGLSEEAEKAVRRWKFRPGTLNGEPVDTIFNHTVTFKVN